MWLLQEPAGSTGGRTNGPRWGPAYRDATCRRESGSEAAALRKGAIVAHTTSAADNTRRAPVETVRIPFPPAPATGKIADADPRLWPIRAIRGIFVHRMTDPAPERMLEGITDMICRYIFTEERP